MKDSEKDRSLTIKYTKNINPHTNFSNSNKIVAPREKSKDIFSGIGVGVNQN
jgi:hypothetical protein